MCILIVKPTGVKTPSMKVLKRCWDNNPDGAGVAYAANGELHLNKGFMRWDDFRDFIKDNTIDNYPAIIHFRIATHGTVKPENTHPFTVNADIIAGHNGMLSVKNEGDWTDSETFFKRICAPILKSFSIHSEVFSRVIDAMIGTSKLAFLNRKGDYKIFGAFTEDNGVLYSNTTYKTERYPTYNDYDDYYSGRYSGYGKYSSGFDNPNYRNSQFPSTQPKKKSIDEVAKERNWDKLDIDAFSTKQYYTEVGHLMGATNMTYAQASEVLDDWFLTTHKNL